MQDTCMKLYVLVFNKKARVPELKGSSGAFFGSGH